MKVAFLGLGVMGYPMAGHLQKAGHDVAVYNRTFSKAESWAAEYGGKAFATPAEAAKDCEIVFCCVGDDADVRAVAIGQDGAFDVMAKDGVFVDHTTTSANLARELYEAAQARGLHFVDAPISGGQSGAENGQLSVMCGGDQAAFDKAQPLMDVYGKMVRLVGETGSGQLTKMVNQICIAGTVQGLSEALHFARVAGLDFASVIEVVSKGAAQSWQMENRWETMEQNKFDYGFAVDWMRKDLGHALTEARRNGAHLPVAALVDQFYSEVQALGGSRWDTSSLIARLEASAPDAKDTKARKAS